MSVAQISLSPPARGTGFPGTQPHGPPHGGACEWHQLAEPALPRLIPPLRDARAERKAVAVPGMEGGEAGGWGSPHPGQTHP